MEDMLKDFVTEALDLATNVEQHLLSLEKNPDDKETLNAVFRSFHTIKGGAGFMSLPAMVSACHLTENLFDGLRLGKVAVTPLAIEAALRASGFVADQLNELANGAAPERLSNMPPDLEALLTRAIDGDADHAAEHTLPIALTSVSQALSPAVGQETLLQPVSAQGEINWDVYYYALLDIAAPTPVETAPATPAAGHTPGALQISNPAAQAPTAAVAPAYEGVERRAGNYDGVDRRAPPTAVKEDSIRIDSSKLDALLDIAGESVQSANQGNALIEKISQFPIDDPELAKYIEALSETLARGMRYSTDLQKASLATRMQPVGKLFQKFPRLVRDLSRDLGKDIDLVIEGAETEVDRVVVESLYDPLVHMLRNALDHGIENPEERFSARKPAKAILHLKAWQEANSVMIVLADDGKGMDPDRLREKAIAKGLIGAGDARTTEEALRLVFLPGFSTKDVASSVSGRGVGMDVVKTAVEKNRGMITIDSKLGQGTTFSIRLPIELSIVPTMLVTTSGASLGIPLSLVMRVVELPEMFKTVSGGPVMVDQGVPLPVVSLASALGYAETKEKVGLVVSAIPPYILTVDLVDGTADLVIKPLTALSVAGLTGTARSAEGHLVLIVDPEFIQAGCKVS